MTFSNDPSLVDRQNCSGYRTIGTFNKPPEYRVSIAGLRKGLGCANTGWLGNIGTNLYLLTAEGHISNRSGFVLRI